MCSLLTTVLTLLLNLDFTPLTTILWERYGYGSIIENELQLIFSVSFIEIIKKSACVPLPSRSTSLF